MTGAGPASIADTTASPSRVSNATELGVGGGVPGGGPTGIIGRGAGGPAAEAGVPSEGGGQWTELGAGGAVPGGGPMGIIGRGAGPAWAGRALGRALGTARCGPCELLLEEWLELEVAGSVHGMPSGV